MWTKRTHYLREVSEHLILSEKSLYFCRWKKIRSIILNLLKIKLNVVLGFKGVFRKPSEHDINVILGELEEKNLCYAQNINFMHALKYNATNIMFLYSNAYIDF